MSNLYGKGSVIYKILILVLTAALVGSIYYPKKLWEREAKNTDICRYRMENVYNSELQYQRFNSVYANDLTSVINFIKTDTAYHAYVDSSLGNKLDEFVIKFDELIQMQRNLTPMIMQTQQSDSAAVDTIASYVDNYTFRNRLLRDAMEAFRETMSIHPCAPIAQYDKGLEVIERKDFFLQFEIIRRMVAQGQNQSAEQANEKILDNYQTIASNLTLTKQHLDDIFTAVDSLSLCPTTRKPLSLSVIDTSVIKVVVVACPIDSLDIAKVDHDFLLSTIGALKIENHGKIESGEKSWEKAGGSK